MAAAKKAVEPSASDLAAFAVAALGSTMVKKPRKGQQSTAAADGAAVSAFPGDASQVEGGAADPAAAPEERRRVVSLVQPEEVKTDEGGFPKGHVRVAEAAGCSIRPLLLLWPLVVVSPFLGHLTSPHVTITMSQSSLHCNPPAALTRIPPLAALIHIRIAAHIESPPTKNRIASQMARLRTALEVAGEVDYMDFVAGSLEVSLSRNPDS